MSSALDQRVRFEIYRCFAEHGAAPELDALASQLGAGVADVEASLDRLAAAHLLVLAPATHRVWMAHPFSNVPTAFRVDAGARRWFANCAWDALAIPSLLGIDAEVMLNGAHFRVERGALSGATGFVHYAIPPRAFWDNIGFT